MAVTGGGGEGGAVGGVCGPFMIRKVFCMVAYPLALPLRLTPSIPTLLAIDLSLRPSPPPSDDSRQINIR